jgi:predicted MFS family arabinose efflux permease
MSLGDEIDGPVGPSKADVQRERAILLTLAAVQLTSIVDFMVIMPLGPQLRRTLEISTNQFGVVVSSYTVAAGLAGLAASALVDRFGRRAAFLSLYAGFLIGTLLCGVAPSYGTLLAARVVTGAFGGILGGLAMAIVGDVFPYERRGRATGALMSAFSLASIVGVPFGLYLGNEFGWHAPFLLLAGLGCPILVLGMKALPPLRDHLAKKGDATNPLATLVGMYTEPNHLRAFALTVTMMLGSFSVIPYISVYFVGNAGVDEKKLPLIYILGGLLSLVASPVLGRLADRFGKLQVYRVVAPCSALLMLVLTTLPKVGLLIASTVFASLMASNAGRMVAAMAMITGSVESRRRGGFMSANSSVQHLALGLGTFLGGLLITDAPDGSLQGFGLAGILAAGSTLLSVWLAGHLRLVKSEPADLNAFEDVADPNLAPEPA